MPEKECVGTERVEASVLDFAYNLLDVYKLLDILVKIYEEI